MKTPNNKLYQLVQAMTAAEKRYFKRHYASDKNQTTLLFDFINSMDSYDEEIVKSNFKDSTISKNLKVYKVQLFKLILKSLTSHRHSKNVKSKIRNGLEAVDILVEKKLYEAAFDRLKQLKVFCQKYEAYTYLLEISEEEHLLAQKSQRIKHQISMLEDHNQQYLEHLFRRFNENKNIDPD